MKNALGKIFVLLLSIACIAVCVLLASVLSSAITVSGSTSTSSYDGFEIYAISLGSYTSKQAAEATEEDVMQRGGAGYIYKKNEIYYVLASAYERENDAKLVKENLAASNKTCTIMKIEISAPDLSKTSSSSQAKSFLSALGEIKNSVLKLYDVSVALDTKTVDETKAKIQIIEIKGSLEKEFEKLSRGTNAVDGIYYQTIKNTFASLEKRLADLRNYQTINGISLSTMVKKTYLNFFFELDSLVSALNNEF